MAKITKYSLKYYDYNEQEWNEYWQKMFKQFNGKPNSRTLIRWAVSDGVLVPKTKHKIRR